MKDILFLKKSPIIIKYAEFLTHISGNGFNLKVIILKSAIKCVFLICYNFIIMKVIKYTIKLSTILYIKILLMQMILQLHIFDNVHYLRLKL